MPFVSRERYIVYPAYFNPATGAFEFESAPADEQDLAISVSASGILVAAVASTKIRVTNIVLVAAGTVNVKFQSHTAGDRTGAIPLVANTGFAPGYNPKGHFQTVAGESLDINLSAGIGVFGWMSYVLVTS